MPNESDQQMTSASAATGTHRPLRTAPYMTGGLTKIKHRDNYELLPESELDEKLLKEPLTRDNYIDKFHTLLYYEEHEHARVLKERCDKSLKVTLFKVDGELYASLARLSTTDVAYAQQAAGSVEITVDGITVNAEIIVDNRELEVINVKFNDSTLKPISSPQTMPVHFIVKHSYFKNLHFSLDRISSDMINHLIPSRLKPQKKRFPRIPRPTELFLWLDKEYQLLALKKMMVCDNTAPFLLTGPFGTGKTRVLATAAITFLKRPANRVLICTSHLQSADAYIDNYFGPMVDHHTLPHNVDPIRLVGDRYKYSGNYECLCKNSHNYEDKNPIRKSRLIITTFLTAPQLINLKVKCFTHILIDEGAQKYEAETIAPLGLANDNTKIVIAGDHLQV